MKVNQRNKIRQKYKTTPKKEKTGTFTINNQVWEYQQV